MWSFIPIFARFQSFKIINKSQNICGISLKKALVLSNFFTFQFFKCAKGTSAEQLFQIPIFQVSQKKKVIRVLIWLLRDASEKHKCWATFSNSNFSSESTNKFYRVLLWLHFTKNLSDIGMQCEILECNLKNLAREDTWLPFISWFFIKSTCNNVALLPIFYQILWLNGHCVTKWLHI